MFVGLAVAGSFCAQNMLSASEVGDFPILSLIGAIAFYGLAAFGFVMQLIGLNFAIVQKKLNKQTLRKVASIMSYVLIPLSIIAVVVTISFISTKNASKCFCLLFYF